MDFVEVMRRDGTTETTTFPKKGWFQHDAIHLIVESRLGFRTGFWGRVSNGAAPETIGAVAKSGGHASSSRAANPNSEIVELIQAERVVECFEAEIWAEMSDIETFRSVLAAACAHSKVPTPELSDKDITDIRARLTCLHLEWRGLAIGESLQLEWQHP